ncbi:hypothetical protein DL96DRAFT_1301223 [Flagelloscypha sp. PMI_526]|nr:hypothetical protein DL96DRAFT_1301223 [Flagelloscypha sp. PMI_526]
MFVTEIRRGFDWALGAWPNVGMEKSISYAGKSTGSINNPRGVEGSWIPSHFAFKDGPFGNGPLVDEPKCPQNAFYPKMDETLGKHSIFIKCYRLGFRPLYMLPIQITVPTVSEPKSHWRDFLRQLFPTVLETCWNVVGSSSPPAPSSALQDAFFAPASFLSKIGYGIPPRHPLDDVIEEVFHNVTDAQAVIIHDDDFEALKRWEMCIFRLLSPRLTSS